MGPVPDEAVLAIASIIPSTAPKIRSVVSRFLKAFSSRSLKLRT
jgi:hypothetical protein